MIQVSLEGVCWEEGGWPGCPDQQEVLEADPHQWVAHAYL